MHPLLIPGQHLSGPIIQKHTLIAPSNPHLLQRIAIGDHRNRPVGDRHLDEGSGLNVNIMDVESVDFVWPFHEKGEGLFESEGKPGGDPDRKGDPPEDGFQRFCGDPFREPLNSRNRDGGGDPRGNERESPGDENQQE